jgi:hypothetical protein
MSERIFHFIHSDKTACQIMAGLAYDALTKFIFLLQFTHLTFICTLGSKSPQINQARLLRNRFIAAGVEL